MLFAISMSCDALSRVVMGDGSRVLWVRPLGVLMSSIGMLVILLFILSLNFIHYMILSQSKNNRIYDSVEAEARKSQASFQIIQVSCEALDYFSHTLSFPFLQQQMR